MNKHFHTSESGAVTVDWVVLTAGLVGLGLATMAVVSTGVQDTSTDISEQLTSDHIIQTDFSRGAWSYDCYSQSSCDTGASRAANWDNDTLMAQLRTAIFDLGYEAALIQGGEIPSAGDTEEYMDEMHGYLAEAERRGLTPPTRQDVLDHYTALGMPAENFYGHGDLPEFNTLQEYDAYYRENAASYGS